MRWYALKCLTDQFDAKGKLDYKAGDVKSFGTILSGTDAELLAKGIKAIDIGDFPETGPDFSLVRFNPVTELMEPVPPDPPNAARVLLNKASWSSNDQEDALRLLLGVLAN